MGESRRVAGEEIESGGAIYRVNTESRLPT